MTPKYKKISPADIKPGDLYCGYEFVNDEGKTIKNICSVFIDKEGKPAKARRTAIKEDVLYYYKKYTKEEEDKMLQDAYDLSNPRNQLNLMGLHTDLYDVGDSAHDGFNAWIVYDWKKQLAKLKDENFFIVGVVKEAPYGCTYMKNPMALVVEFDNNGSRIWYHADPNKITKMRAESLEAYNALMAK